MTLDSFLTKYLGKIKGYPDDTQYLGQSKGYPTDSQYRGIVIYIGKPIC